jgi:hypothetical protein
VPEAFAMGGVGSGTEALLALFMLGCIYAYLIGLVCLFFYLKGRKLKIMVSIVLFISLLFIPPFQLEERFIFHYRKPIHNIPRDKTTESVEVLGANFIKRKNGELIYFPTKFEGKRIPVKFITPDTALIIEKKDLTDMQQ